MGEETTSSANKGTGPKGSFQSKESKYVVHLIGTKEQRYWSPVLNSKTETYEQMQRKNQD